VLSTGHGAPRLGKAIFAVAHKMPGFGGSILKTELLFHALGGDYFDRSHPGRTVKRLGQSPEGLGLNVTPAPARPLTPTADGS